MLSSCSLGGVSRSWDVSVSQSNKLHTNVPLINRGERKKNKKPLICKKQRKRPRGNSIITEYSEDNLDSGQQMSLSHLWEEQQKVQINKEGSSLFGS